MGNYWERSIIILFCALLGAAGLRANPESLARGRMALEDGFHSRALQAFEGILQDAGASALVRSEAADLLLRTYAVQMQFDAIAAFLEDPVRVLYLDEVSRAYWHAILLDRQGDFAAALARLAEVAGSPESAIPVRVLRLRASIYLQLGQYEEAIGLFAQLATTSTDAQLAAQSRLDWGRALQSAGLLEQAIAVWEPLMGLTNAYPRLSAQASYLIGESYMSQGAYGKAEAVLAPVAAEVGQGDMLSLSALIAQAKSRQLGGNPAGAIELYRQGIKSLGEHVLRRRLQVELGRTLLDSGALEEGRDTILAYASAHVDSPEAPGLLLELGRRLISAGRYDEAIAIYQRYLEAFGSRNGVASHGRGLALQGAGRHGEAALAFEQAFAEASEGARKEESQYLAGQARFANAQYRLALEQFEAYISRYPEGRFRLQAQYQRANAQGALGQLGEAVAGLEKLAAEASSDPMGEKALLRIGTLYLDRNFWVEAEAAFDQLLAAYPEGVYYMEGLHGRGTARYQQWKAEAQADFARVAAEGKDAALREHAAFMQAVSHFRLGQDQEAIAVCERLLLDSPDTAWAPEVRFRLAQFAFNGGQYEVAEKAFLAFEQQHPGHAYIPQVLYRAGLASIRRQQYLKGNEILGRLAQQYPEHELLPYARFHQGEALAQLGRHPTAILTFQEVVRLAPNTEIAYMAWGREGDSHFALAAEDAARLEAAARAYQVVVQGGGDVRQQDKWQAAYKLGRTYEKMGRSAAAMEQYYDGVIVPYHLALDAGEPVVGAEEQTWYSRAVRSASEILERQKDWRSLARILDRAAGTKADIAVEAGRKARAIRAEYWWLFY